MKNFINLTIVAILLCSLNSLATAEEIEQFEQAVENDNFYYTCFVRENLTEEANQLNTFLSDYFDAVKLHNLKKLKDLYAGNFLSGDGFDKNKMIEVLEESWDLSPNLEYSAEIQDIKFDSAFASVELRETLTGTTREVSEITGDNGDIESTTRVLLYMQKHGKGWKIVSDRTLYEETSIKYGAAKGLDINIYAPDQVLADKNYSVSIEAEIPEDMFALGSIVSEPLIFPRKRPEEVFRQIPLDIKHLERVIQANGDRKNELAVASVSYCKVEKNAFTSPDIELAGTAILIKRVNVSNIASATSSKK